MSHYPMGARMGEGRRTCEYRCTNEDCPGYPFVWEVDGIEELGGWWPYREEDRDCPECGEKGEPA